jgi:hypothetical protein
MVPAVDVTPTAMPKQFGIKSQADSAGKTMDHCGLWGQWEGTTNSLL